jgi:hypothetical protein
MDICEEDIMNEQIENRNVFTKPVKWNERIVKISTSEEKSARSKSRVRSLPISFHGLDAPVLLQIREMQCSERFFVVCM